jgi:hypothetical protein
MNQFNPSDVSVYSDGTVYVLDSQNYRIQKWEPGAITGTTVTNLNTYSSRFSVDTNGNIYVLNQYNPNSEMDKRRIMDNCCRRKWRRAQPIIN